MLQYDSLQDNPLLCLPQVEDRPETDSLPGDNELQVIIPTGLWAILSLVWADPSKWFFGINIGLHAAPTEPAIGPDGLLSLGVKRCKRESPTDPNGERGR
ncbi:hypothetical protein BST81_17140 [Leptolyngbya sp. 'hensonii']|uniref:hypothetical protein n=1 Tax=Leptolyngbya sp. 'hensonii' TaxID=1922337 RepID=UPI00094FF58D|nr:hypothetical protein [Leptolyngbya sp. 'hensonii']OLP17084.1 hypothetical protein BST81_17140 [Leptolyngbya sp. 'hensonii']